MFFAGSPAALAAGRLYQFQTLMFPQKNVMFFAGSPAALAAGRLYQFSRRRRK